MIIKGTDYGQEFHLTGTVGVRCQYPTVSYDIPNKKEQRKFQAAPCVPGLHPFLNRES